MGITEEQASAKARRWASICNEDRHRIVVRGRSGKGKAALQTRRATEDWHDEGGEWLAKSVFVFLEDALTAADFTAATLRKVIRHAKATLPIIDERKPLAQTGGRR